MKKLIIAIALIGIGLAGCKDRSATQVTSRTDEAPSGAKEVAKVAETTLADGFVPAFRHKIRSQRHEAAGTGFRHVVIVEYFDHDAPGMVDALAAELSAAGFEVSGPSPHGGASRLLATGKEGTQMAADVHGPDAVKLNDAAARGFVYFSWRDSESR